MSDYEKLYRSEIWKRERTKSILKLVGGSILALFLSVLLIVTDIACVVGMVKGGLNLGNLLIQIIGTIFIIRATGVFIFEQVADIRIADDYIIKENKQ